jgi:hypothetical protein
MDQYHNHLSALPISSQCYRSTESFMHTSMTSWWCVKEGVLGDKSWATVTEWLQERFDCECE